MTHKFLNCMFERTLGLQNMHAIGIDYVNVNDVKSNIYKSERKQLCKHILRKYRNKRKYSNENTSFLPVNE